MFLPAILMSALEPGSLHWQNPGVSEGGKGVSLTPNPLCRWGNQGWKRGNCRLSQDECLKGQEWSLIRQPLEYSELASTCELASTGRETEAYLPQATHWVIGMMGWGLESSAGPKVSFTPGQF